VKLLGQIYDVRASIHVAGTARVGIQLYNLVIHFCVLSSLVRVRVTLRLAVYRQSVRLGAKLFETQTHDILSTEPVRL
jgi:hypothetical protein